jgi:hypothetical protein
MFGAMAFLLTVLTDLLPPAVAGEFESFVSMVVAWTEECSMRVLVERAFPLELETLLLFRGGVGMKLTVEHDDSVSELEGAKLSEGVEDRGRFCNWRPEGRTPPSTDGL